MSEIVFTIVMFIFVALFVLIMLGILASFFDDTETMKAIDEKIAGVIRGSGERKEGE